MRLQQDGKRRDIGLGSAKLLILAEAREKAGQLRKAIKVEKRDVLAERKDEASAKVTFREAARQYHAENEAGWKKRRLCPPVARQSGKTTPSPSWASCPPGESPLPTLSPC
ncbi:hypothetical protein ACFSTD_09935 [Novosphingobium colocasiae]